jgi:hypothetical protein
MVVNPKPAAKTATSLALPTSKEVFGPLTAILGRF